MALLASVSECHVFVTHWEELCTNKAQRSIVTPSGDPIKAVLVLAQAELSSETPLETSGFQQSIAELDTSVCDLLATFNLGFFYICILCKQGEKTYTVENWKRNSFHPIKFIF